MRTALRIVLVCCVAVVTSLVGITASQATTGYHRHGTSCSGSWANPGMLTSGRYHDIRVSGVCMVPDGVNVKVHGDIKLNPGSTLFAITTQSMTVWGNIFVGKQAILALGCGPGVGCDGVNGDPQPSTDTVNGNIIAIGALAMYLNGDTVNGNVAFLGGGWGRDCTDPNADLPTDPLGHDLVVKDNTFRGSVTLAGWAGCWMGFIRNTVHGIVTISGNYANPDNIVTDSGTPEYQGLDSTEVVANTVWGVLGCFANTPAAQFGDAVEGAPPGYGTNTVHGAALGECRALST